MKHERQWTLAQIHQALVGAGLVVERLGEHPESYWHAFPNLPDGVRRTIPNSFTILARKPGEGSDRVQHENGGDRQDDRGDERDLTRAIAEAGDDE